MIEKFLKKAKILTAPTIKLEHSASLEVGSKIKFKWYDEKLTESISYGDIIEAPEGMNVIKVVTPEETTHVIPTEWIMEEAMQLDSASTPESYDLGVFTEKYLG